MDNRSVLTKLFRNVVVVRFLETRCIKKQIRPQSWAKLTGVVIVSICVFITRLQNHRVEFRVEFRVTRFSTRWNFYFIQSSTGIDNESYLMKSFFYHRVPDFPYSMTFVDRVLHRVQVLDDDFTRFFFFYSVVPNPRIQYHLITVYWVVHHRVPGTRWCSSSSIGTRLSTKQISSSRNSTRTQNSTRLRLNLIYKIRTESNPIQLFISDNKVHIVN